MHQPDDDRDPEIRGVGRPMVGPPPRLPVGTHPAEEATDLERVRGRLAGVGDPLALLAGFFAFSPVAYQVYRVDGRSLLTNAAFLRLFGSEPPPEYSVLTDEIAERGGVLGLIRRAFAGEVVRTPPVWYDPRELRRVQVDQGNRVAIEATFFPLFDATGAVSHVAIAFRDVTPELAAREAAETERDRAEALAAERQAVLAQLAEGVILTDAEGQIVFVNDAARRLHGVAELGVPIWGYSEAYHLFTLDGEPYPPQELPLARAVLRGETVKDARWRIRRPDGTEVMVEGSAAPVRGTDDRRLGNALSFRDITAQVELEREKDAFLAAAAHDLKNPITTARAVAQLLARRARAGAVDPGQLTEGLARIEGAALQMERLVDELLDLARIRMDRPLTLDRQPVDLVALARDAVARHQQATDRHLLRLEAEVSEVVGAWDATRLSRLLDNLLGNAIKYSPDGGTIVVRVAREPGRRHTWASLSVSDEGLGIPAADLPHIFEHFRRGANVAVRIPGTGIGLAAAKHVVEQHGGTITAASHEGAGSTFTTRLPL